MILTLLGYTVAKNLTWFNHKTIFPYERVGSGVWGSQMLSVQCRSLSVCGMHILKAIGTVQKGLACETRSGDDYSVCWLVIRLVMGSLNFNNVLSTTREKIIASLRIHAYKE